MHFIDAILQNLHYFNVSYYMACVCSRYNARSDWLIVTEL